MLVLALDTSTSRGSLALLDGTRLLAEYTLESSSSHLNRLLAGIDNLVQETRQDIRAVDLIVVSRGPGNFTGLRLGLSVAKGLALGVGCPVMTINTLDALAANLPFTPLPVCPILDAKKNALYAAFYHNQGIAGQRSSDYLLLPVADLAALILEPTLITGPGLERYGPLLQDMLGDLAVFPPPELCHVRASVVARLGVQEYEAGQVPNLETLTPFYLRPPDATLPQPAPGTLRGPEQVRP